MFGSKKWKQELISRLTGQADDIHRLLIEVEALKKRQEDTFHGLSDQMEKSRTAVLKHDTSLEEFLSELEEESAEEKMLAGQLAETEAQRDGLLSLAAVYEEQLFALRGQLAGEAWAEQFALLDRRLSQSKRPLGLVTIAEAGIPVDYDLHEVIEVHDAELPEQNGLICEVLAPGLVWRGRTLKKARVSAWRYEEIMGGAE